MRFVIFAIMLLVTTGSQAFEAELLFHWNTPRVKFYYNPAQQPDSVATEDVEHLLAEAAGQWAACGVRLVYAGQSTKAPDAKDGVNTVGWVDRLRKSQGGSMRTIEVMADTRMVASSATHDIREFDIQLSRWKLQNQTVLAATILHELGHAMGLMGHSTEPGSVMELATAAWADEPLQLSENDLAVCQSVYAGRGIETQKLAQR